MRSMAFVVIVLLIVAPAFAGSVVYTFDATAGSILFEVPGWGSASGAVGGTFAVTAFDQGTHFGAGDMFMLEDSDLYNTTQLKLGLGLYFTASIAPGNARFLDFTPASYGYVPGNNVATIVETDVYTETTVMITGAGHFQHTYTDKAWASSLLPYQISFSTSEGCSDVINASILGTYHLVRGVPDVSMTVTLDLILNVQGTAHMIPDPSLGGLTALGLGGAGVWLRRRHS